MKVALKCFQIPIAIETPCTCPADAEGLTARLDSSRSILRNGKERSRDVATDRTGGKRARANAAYELCARFKEQSPSHATTSVTRTSSDTFSVR